MYQRVTPVYIRSHVRLRHKSCSARKRAIPASRTAVSREKDFLGWPEEGTMGCEVAASRRSAADRGKRGRRRWHARTANNKFTVVAVHSL